METSQAAFEDLSLPDGWEWKRLGEICDFIRGVSFDKSEVRTTPQDGYTPILRAGNIRDTLDIEHDLIWIPSRYVSNEQRLLLKDIAVCMSSGSPEVVGKTAPLVSDFDGAVGAFCGVIRARNPDESDFIAYWLRSPFYAAWRKSQTRGANIQNLRFSEFASIKIPFPPVRERHRITASLYEKLTAAERARAAAEAQLKAAKDLPAAYLREVFDSPETQQWAREKLGNVSVISGGIQKTPERKPKNFHRPYLTVRNVQRGYLDLSELERFEITKSELNRLRLMSGDILIVEGNGSLEHIGRNALFKGEVEDCIHQNHIIRVRLDGQMFLPEFVSRFLNSNSGKSQMIQKAMTTSGLYTLSAGKVAALEIPMPSMTGQRKIVETLNKQIPTAENACEIIKGQFETINTLPSALLRQAFTGKL